MVVHGAIKLSGTTNDTHITGCIFQSNRATGDGGAVSMLISGNAYITDCTLQNNKADGYGGGGAVSLSGSTGDAYITGCAFQNNSAAYDGDGGGAVHCHVTIGPPQNSPPPRTKHFRKKWSGGNNIF